MPELPEVETVRRILEQEVRGKTIRGVLIYRAKNVLTGAGDFIGMTKGRQIVSFARKGKFLVFRLDGGYSIVSHLRMEGKYYTGLVGDPVEKHEILRFEFTDGTRLSYLDTRKFGVLLLKKNEELYSTPPLSEVGKEPWEITPEELLKAYRRKKGPLKEALLDQGIMCGLGNIYADEALFATGLHPLKKCPSLSLEDAEAIVRESSRILNMAIVNGGSTIKSYHPREGMDGRMQNALLAYGQAGKPCPKCSLPLKKIKIGGRGTTYCPHCQAENEHPYLVTIVGPIAAGKSTLGRLLEKRGYVRIDFDEIVHGLYRQKEIVTCLTGIFGKGVVKDRAIDRSALLAAIAQKPEKLPTLEEAIHPRVFESALKSLGSGDARKYVIEAPVYLDTPLEEVTSCLVYVEASTDIRAMRLKERGKDVDKALALTKDDVQTQLRKNATLLISGEGSVLDMEKYVNELPYLA